MTKKPGKLQTKLQIRLSHVEKNRIRALASLYASGNMSLYVVYSALNAPRKQLSTEELRESSRNFRRKP